jgi:DNA-directed RNA polymerase subunit omega
MGLEKGFDSSYRYVLVAARRARQLLSGAKPTIDTATRKPCKIAQEEIQAGKVQWNTTEPPPPPAEAAGELPDKATLSKDEEDE